MDTLDLFSSLAYLSCAVCSVLIDLVVIELVTFSYHARNTVYGLLEVKEIQCTVSKKFNKYSPIRTWLVYKT